MTRNLLGPLLGEASTAHIIMEKTFVLGEILKYFREEGFINGLIRSVWTVFEVIFKYKRMYLYSYNLHDAGPRVTCGISVSFRKASIDELSLLHDVMYQDNNELQSRFDQGNVCYVGSVSDKIIYSSWVDFKKMFIPEIDNQIPVQDQEAYVYNVRTKSDYRGKGISPYAYSIIANDLRKHDFKRLYVVVEQCNIASVRSIEKAGFKRIREIVYLRLFSFFRNYHEHDLTTES